MEEEEDNNCELQTTFMYPLALALLALAPLALALALMTYCSEGLHSTPILFDNQTYNTRVAPRLLLGSGNPCQLNAAAGSRTQGEHGASVPPTPGRCFHLRL